MRARRLYTWKRVGQDLQSVYGRMAAETPREDRIAARIAA